MCILSYICTQRGESYARLRAGGAHGGGSEELDGGCRRRRGEVGGVVLGAVVIAGGGRASSGSRGREARQQLGARSPARQEGEGGAIGDGAWLRYAGRKVRG